MLREPFKVTFREDILSIEPVVIVGADPAKTALELKKDAISVINISVQICFGLFIISGLICSI